LLNIGSILALTVHFIFLSHNVDWRKQGAPIEHVMARRNRFDRDMLENASVKNPYYNIPEMIASEESLGLRSTFFFRTLYESVIYKITKTISINFDLSVFLFEIKIVGFVDNACNFLLLFAIESKNCLIMKLSQKFLKGIGLYCFRNMAHSQKTITINSMVIIAIIAALALLGVVVITIVTIPLLQQAEARGCINPHAPGGGSIAFNAAKGRCAR
jgi:hypothetical protein